MSTRHFKWKQVGSTGSRLNRMLSGDDYRLPTKFVPSIKDRSESVDRMFNSSRSRMHSSLELTALNRTTEEEEAPPLLQKTSRLQIKTKKDQQLQKRVSTITSVLPGFGTKNPTLIKEPSSKLNSQLVAQIKKEYVNFKKNILIELERQRQMIQKVIKEVLLTVEHELHKITSISIEHKQNNVDVLVEEENREIKTIQQWKKTLNNISIAEKPQGNAGLSKKQSIKPFKTNTTFDKQKTIEPPKPPVNLDLFLGSIDSLKKRIQEMDTVFIKTLQKNKKTTA